MIEIIIIGVTGTLVGFFFGHWLGRREVLNQYRTEIQDGMDYRKTLNEAIKGKFKPQEYEVALVVTPIKEKS